MSDDPLQRLRQLCLALPETVERLSHGEPTWFVRGRKTFVTYASTTTTGWASGAPRHPGPRTRTGRDRRGRDRRVPYGRPEAAGGGAGPRQVLPRGVKVYPSGYPVCLEPDLESGAGAA